MTDTTQHTLARLMADAPDVAGNRYRFLPIAMAVQAHLAAIEGLSEATVLDAIVHRTLTPTADRLRAEVAALATGRDMSALRFECLKLVLGNSSVGNTPYAIRDAQQLVDFVLGHSTESAGA